MSYLLYMYTNIYLQAISALFFILPFAQKDVRTYAYIVPVFVYYAQDVPLYRIFFVRTYHYFYFYLCTPML